MEKNLASLFFFLLTALLCVRSLCRSDEEKVFFSNLRHDVRGARSMAKRVKWISHRQAGHGTLLWWVEDIGGNREAGENAVSTVNYRAVGGVVCL